MKLMRKGVGKSIENSEISAGSVGSNELAEDAVTITKLANNSVSTNQLVDASVSNDKLTINSVRTDNIVTKNITTDKIADGAIDTTQIADDAITRNKIAVGAIGTGELDTTSVTAVKIASGAILESKIATGVVSTEKIADNAITTAKILGSQITNHKMADNAINTAEIVNGAITSDKLASILKKVLALGSDNSQPYHPNLMLFVNGLARVYVCSEGEIRNILTSTFTEGIELGIDLATTIDTLKLYIKSIKVDFYAANTSNKIRSLKIYGHSHGNDPAVVFSNTTEYNTTQTIPYTDTSDIDCSSYDFLTIDIAITGSGSIGNFRIRDIEIDYYYA